MRPASTASTAVLALLLAGCSGGEPAAPEHDVPLTLASSTFAPAAPMPWTAETVPVSFSGNLGTSLHGCVFPASTCHTAEATTDTSDLTIERPGANFTGLDLTVAWTAQTPATATLTLGFMVM